MDLKESGIKRNKYRDAIWDFLLKTKEHPTPYRIYEHVKKEYPQIALATIYNTLQLFKEKNLIISFQGTDNSEHYDAALEDHAHFICQKCGKIIDLEKISVSGSENSEILNNLEIKRSCIYLFGICTNCRETGKK